MPTYEGRLELTWTNKPLRLLAHEDGSYEWVPPSDYRVAEVRLLHDAGTVGEVHGTRERAKDNLLIRGDALNALTSLIELPEFEREYVGKVKLAYLDPPFNTQQSFLHYDDALEHSVWLTMMRDRLAQVRTLLADDGTVWVHLDDSEIHRARCVLDEVFGSGNFVAQIIASLNPKGRQLGRFFATSHEYLLVYARSIDDANLTCALSDEVRIEDFPVIDEEGRRHRLLPLRNTNKIFNPQTRPNLHYELYADVVTGSVSAEPRPGYVPVFPVFGDGGQAVWRWSRALVRERADELAARIVRGQTGERVDIFQKDFHSEERTKKLRTVWLSDEVGSSDSAKQELKVLFPTQVPFATPKPERLLYRIIEIATNPGDIVNLSREQRWMLSNQYRILENGTCQSL